MIRSSTLWKQGYLDEMQALAGEAFDEALAADAVHEVGDRRKSPHIERYRVDDRRHPQNHYEGSLGEIVVFAESDEDVCVYRTEDRKSVVVADCDGELLFVRLS